MKQKSLTDLDCIQEPIMQASSEVKTVVQKVLQLEKDKLYLKNPRNITEDIVNIIKDTIE